MHVCDCFAAGLSHLVHLVCILKCWRNSLYNWLVCAPLNYLYSNEKFSVACSSYNQSNKCGNFTLLFCRGKHGFVLKCVPHVQPLIFPNWNNQMLYLRRCYSLPLTFSTDAKVSLLRELKRPFSLVDFVCPVQIM